MYGLSINLLMDTEPSNNDNGMTKFSNLVWSAYDRVHFKEVENFKDYFQTDNILTKWTGNIQSLHLYSNSRERNLRINSNPNKFYLYNSQNHDKEYPLGMIMSLKINESIFFNSELKKNNGIIECIKDNLRAFDNICFDILFSLGEEDLVLVLLGHSIDQFMIIVNMIRDIRFSHKNNGDSKELMCIQTYSFVFQNSNDYASISKTEISDACIFLSLADNINENKFCNDIGKLINNQLNPYKLTKTEESDQEKKIDVESTLMIGEYDIKLTIPHDLINQKFFEIYSSDKSLNNFLNGTSDFYKNNIRNSKTIWCSNLKNINGKVPDIIDYVPEEEAEEVAFQFEGDFEKDINGVISSVYSQREKCEPHLFFVYNNVISFLNEAKFIYKSVTNKQWKYIVREQINAFLVTYKKYNQLIKSHNDYISNLETLVSDMRKSLFHINRSKELFYNIPTHSLQYSGSFNKILLSYYCYINELLKFAFRKPHNKDNNSEQSNIIFFVFFSMSPKVHSSIYFNDNTKPSETKIVGFEIPYLALYDFKTYFISLTHEVYHLIAPFDRKQRNKKIVDLWKLSFLTNEFCECLNFVLPELLEIKKGETIEVIKHHKIFDGNGRKVCFDKISNNTQFEFQFGDVKELIELFVKKLNTSELYFGNLETEFDSMNHETLTANLNNKMEDNKLNAFVEILFSKLCDFCDSEMDSFQKEGVLNCANYLNTNLNIKKIRKHQELIELLKYKKHNFGIHRIQALLMCMKECLCDTYSIQLAYERDKEKGIKSSLYSHIKYLLNFFESTQVVFNKNIDAIFRIKFLFVYFGFYPTLDELIVEFGNTNGKKIYEDILRGSDSNQFSQAEIDIFIEIIRDDDFLEVCKKYYSCDNFAQILKDLGKIKTEYIIPISSTNVSFGDIISIVIKLNKPFCYAKKGDIVYDFIPQKINSHSNSQKKEKDKYSNLMTYFVRDFEEFFRQIKKSKDVDKNQVVWYRGLCNADYTLLPSLYINLKDVNTIPYYYQLALLRQSYYQTRKHYVDFAENETPLVARQSLMQHYGVPTNLLDFTTDPLSALFWALNPENENDIKRDQGLQNIPPAAVYIFYPHKYEKAYKYIVDKLKISKQKYFGDIYGIYTHNCLDYEYIIDKKPEYIIKKYLKSYKKDARNYHDFSKDSILYKRRPIPLVIPQVNDRINAQAGTFVAFNFFHVPVDCDKKYAHASQHFDYISLENIQEKYAELCEKNGDYKKEHLFLEKILISPISKLDIKNSLDAVFGYSKSRAYPDLPNLLNSVKDHTFGYKKQYNKE